MTSGLLKDIKSIPILLSNTFKEIQHKQPLYQIKIKFQGNKMNTPKYLLQALNHSVKFAFGRTFKELGLSMDRTGSKLTYDIAYLEPLSRHRTKLPIYDLAPESENAFIAPSATLVGEVKISQFASVWYNCVLRGEINAIRVGNFASIGDNTVIHTAASLPTGVPASVNIGKNVTIGNNCSLYSCIIDDDVFIGPKCVILEGAKLERGCMLAANSVVPPGRLIPANQLWGGNPVEYIRDLNIAELWANYTYSYVISGVSDMTKNSFTVWSNSHFHKSSTPDDLEPPADELRENGMCTDIHDIFPRYFS